MSVGDLSASHGNGKAMAIDDLWKNGTSAAVDGPSLKCQGTYMARHDHSDWTLRCWLLRG
jgi:hypothetical protein